MTARTKAADDVRMPISRVNPHEIVDSGVWPADAAPQAVVERLGLAPIPFKSARADVNPP